MQRLFTRTTPLILSGLLALFGAAACGDDDGGNADDADDADDDDDGEDDDGAPDAGGPDAAPPPSRAGTLAVSETVITNPLGLPVPISGAVVGMTYFDSQTGVAPVPGFTSPVGSCLITQYNVTAGEEEPTPTDEGPITVSGTANGDFACGFVAALGEYVCQSTNPVLAGGVPGNANTGTLDPDTDILLLEDAGFTEEMQGMSIQLTGFGAGDGVYPIVAVPDGGETLVLAQVENAGEGDATATFTTFVGASPIPNGAGFEFLDDGTDTITLSKPESDIVPAINRTFLAPGAGLALSDTGAQPHEFPTTAQAVSFICEGDGCGAAPDNENGLINALVINGVTTDAVVDPLDPTNMDAPPVAAFATFSCSVIMTNPEAATVTIPAAGVEAILATNPTRVQVTVGRFIAALINVPNSSTNVVIGHSLTGFTDIP